MITFSSYNTNIFFTVYIMVTYKMYVTTHIHIRLIWQQYLISLMKTEIPIFQQNLSVLCQHPGYICFSYIISFNTWRRMSTKFDLVNEGCMYTQQKSSWTLVKVQFSQKCFILGKLTAYYVKQVNVLFILIPNLKESVDK